MINLFSLFFILLLTGCMNAAVTGAQAVYNRHSLKTTLNDHYTNLRATQAIYLKSNQFDDTHVSVVCFNGVILLTGQVPSAAERFAIERAVRNVAQDNPVELHNQIAISSPSSALTRMSDSWITTKITAQLIASDDVDPSQIKVVTENGTVFLMGIVPHDQGDAAIEIARSTEGVQEVVKMFSWVHISKS